MNRFSSRVHCVFLMLLLSFLLCACDSSKVEDNSDSFKFIFLGDTQENPDEPMQYAVFNNLISSAYETAVNPELVLIAGDLINDGDSATEWDEFFTASEDYFEKMLPVVCVGNHDNSDMQAERFPLDSELGLVGDNNFYSLDYKNIHFVVMDSNLMGGESDKIVKWLEDDLSKANADWIIAMYHHPTYMATEIPKDMARAETIKKNYIPIFEQYGVDMVLCGHQHTYMRTKPIDGIVYMMGNASGKGYGIEEHDYTEKAYSNGSVYSIFEVNSEKIDIKTYNIEDEIIDSFILEK